MAKKKKLPVITMPPTVSPKKHAGGRPSKYTNELAKEICERLAEGQLLIQIVRLNHMPDYSTITRWILHNEEFYTMYAQARAAQADRLAEQCIEMADETRDSDHAQAQRLKVDTRKWYTAKIRPRFYGENGTGFDRAEKNGGSNTVRDLIERFKGTKKRKPGEDEDPGSTESGT